MMHHYPGPPTIPSNALGRLFSYLKSSQAPACTCSLKATEHFLKNNELQVEEITEWLGDHGVECDCHVLAGLWFGWPDGSGN